MESTGCKMKLKKTDNHDPAAKLALRMHFLRKYHSDGGARVLDCCAGSGLLWGEIRQSIKLVSYLGLDVKKKKGRLGIDSSRYLAAGCNAFDVIDVDTYGAPWKHWFEILKHMEQPTTVFLTVGMIKKGGGGALQNEEKEALGITGLHVPMGICGRLHELSVKCCLTACYRYDIMIVDAVEAASTGNARYIGVRLERQKK